MEFITGNKFKKIADYILDENGFNKTNIINKIPIFFVKTDFINLFFERYLPSHPFKIITHNSDYPINESYSKYLNNENLIHWYGQNIAISNEKITSIPIGIANEIWEHGNEQIILNEIDKGKTKTNLLYCNFDINTNPIERYKCLNSMSRNNIKMSERKNFGQYLSELNESYFCLSPNGNGVDCHKTWESMYFKTIPIVTKSININFYKNYPLLVIEDWENFNFKNLTSELYYNIINNSDYNLLTFEYYKQIILN